MKTRIRTCGLAVICLFFLTLSSSAQEEKITKAVAVYIATQVDANGETALHRAVRSGDQEQMQKLLGSGINLDIQNNYKQTALHLAVVRKDKEAVESLVRAGANTQLTDNNNRTAFSEAIASRDKTLVKTFFDGGFSIVGDKKYVQEALGTRDDEMVKTLAIYGADVSDAVKAVTAEGRYATFKTLMEGYKGTTMDGNTFKQGLLNFPHNQHQEYAEIALQKGINKMEALDAGLEADAMEAIDVILSEGGDVKRAIEYGMQKNKFALIENCLVKHNGDVDIPMKYAVEHTNLPLAELALNHKADPNKYIEMTAEKGNNGIMDLLLGRGGNPDLGMMPAIKNNNSSTFELLIKNGAQVNNDQYLIAAIEVNSLAMAETLLNKQRERHGAPRPDPGMLPAILQGNELIVNLLIEQGANTSLVGYIETATAMGHYGITKTLLDHDADPQSGLSNAISRDYIDITELLIENGADVTLSRYMILAAETDNSDMVQLIIESGGDPEAGIETAVSRNRPNSLQTLIDFDADPTKPEYVITAVQGSFDKVLGILIDNGADPHYVEPQTGRTLLHTACINGSEATAFQLIMAENDPNAADANGDTPLHFAVALGKDQEGLVELLIEAGADVNAANHAGVLVLKAAKSAKIKRILKKAGGKNKL